MPKKENPVFELDGIKKSFGTHKVLKNLCLKINTGDFVLLLGANGSGKSTLLRICVGLSRPDKGKVCFPGNNEQKPLEKAVGHAGHSLFLYKNLSVRENIELFARVMGVSLTLDSTLKEWSLHHERNKKIFELSKGLQYRVSLCRAFLNTPQFLFLDEATSSLDEQATILVLNKIKANFQKTGKRGFVLIATHDVRRLRDHANRIMVLKDGVIARDLLDIQNDSPEMPLEEAKNKVIDYYMEANR